MDLYRVFLVSVYVLACYSSLVLMWAEGRPFPSVVTLPLSVLTFYFVDLKQMVRLNTIWANLAGLLGLGAAATEVLSGNPEGRLLGPVHLIVYLLWIVLCQPKRSRQFWFVCVLALLQVVAAAVLTQAQWFGGALMIYVFLGTWTLSVFSLYRTEQEFQEAVGRGDHAAASDNARGPSPAMAPAAELPSSFSVVRGSVQQETSAGWISGRFVTGVAVISFCSIVVGLVAFVLIPRVWIGHGVSFADNPIGGTGRSLTGFSENVKLGDLGEVLESTEKVMEVRVFDERSGEELEVSELAERWGYEEPVFRGAVLGRYDRGQWTADREVFITEEVPRIPPRGQIREEIRLEPIGTNVLFHLGQWMAISSPRSRNRFLSFWATGVLFINRETPDRESVEYRVFAERDAEVVDGRPTIHVGRGAARLYRQLGYSRRHLEMDEEELQPLIDLARQVTGYSPDNPPELNPSPRERAIQLEEFLKFSPEYQYTLNLRIQNPQVDPVVDFLIYRKQGHCEYFASALALMLRAVDVPSRVVNGFKGGEVSRMNGRFVVQQRHAHSWVEALMDDHWLILDPTPYARGESVQQIGSRLGLWRRTITSLGDVWNRYFLNLSFTQQNREIYEPIRESLQGVMASASEVRKSLASLFQTVRRVLSDPARWFSWQGGLMAFVFLLTVAGVVQGIRWLRANFARMAGRLRGTSRNARRMIDFEDRFRRWATGRGLPPKPQQTAREFAQVAAERFHADLAAKGLLHLPGDIAEAFNRVRFGDANLPRDEYARLSRELDQLEAPQPAPPNAGTRGLANA